MASLAAQQYYIEFGTDFIPERLSGLLPQYIPDSCLAGSGMKERWLNMIAKAFKEVSSYTIQRQRSGYKYHLYFC